MEECKLKNRENIINSIFEMSRRMRQKVLKMSLAAGSDSSHFGGGLSIIEIIATLYGSIMQIDKNNPQWTERDRFILSKGHGCLGYYAALAEVGYISEEDLLNFEKTGGFLYGHPVMKRDIGIDFSNGSLGMGLSLGNGVALAGKKRNIDYDVYVIMGDGECNEGSIWEAAMSASHYKLNNLIGIVDKNNFQQTGSNSEIMSVGDLAGKWKSFGWDVLEVDGHNIGELYDAFSSDKPSNSPTVIIAKTVKGKGFSFSENNNAWHHAPLSKSQYEAALEELKY